jgi:hypothetical protein
VGDEDLAEHHRCREQHLGEAVDPEQLDVQVLRRRIEAAADGAARKIAMLATVMTAIAPVSTVRPKPLASPSSARSCRRLVKMGTKGAVNPAATSTSRAISGMRNAALYASSSAPAPYVFAKTRLRTTPMAKYANDRTVRTIAPRGRTRSIAARDVATIAVTGRRLWGGATRSLGGGPRPECAPSYGGRDAAGTAMPL